MLYVYANNLLKYRKDLFRCSIGKNGIKKNKIEGDYCSPEGIFELGNLYYRSDRIKKIDTIKKTIPIKKNMYWSDNPKSLFYNTLVSFPNSSSEKLYRKDDIYDLVLVIKYNINPIIKKKGSAIFMHIAKSDYNPTKGCIALSKKDFIKILSSIRKKERIKIINSNYMSA